MNFRVLTVNVHKGFSLFNRRFVLHELREAVRAVGADLVFLQEVHGAHEHHARKHAGWPAQPQYEYLADTVWSDFAYGRNAVYPHGHHGNALLSRYPIRDQTNHDASIEGDESRGLLHCVVDVPPLDLHIHAICVHLGLRESHRGQQLEQLCRIVATDVPHGAPLIIAGDFNDWRLRGHKRLLHCAGLKEVHASANGRAARTFPARWPLLRLDRIYTRNAHAHHPVPLPARPWSHLSDHAPLAADLRL